MDRELESLNRKVEEIHTLLFRSSPSVKSISQSVNAGWKDALEDSVRKAIADLEETKRSFKSKQIMRIKEDLIKALELNKI